MAMWEVADLSGTEPLIYSHACVITDHVSRLAVTQLDFSPAVFVVGR